MHQSTGLGPKTDDFQCAQLKLVISQSCVSLTKSWSISCMRNTQTVQGNSRVHGDSNMLTYYSHVTPHEHK